jgi:hypothetical protein
MKILIGFLLALFISGQAYAEEKECGNHPNLNQYKPSDIIRYWDDLSTYDNQFIRYSDGCIAFCSVKNKLASCVFPKDEYFQFD